MLNAFPKIKLPLLLFAAVLVLLAMLRLGVWQLDRAAQKTVLLNQVTTRMALPSVPVQTLISQINADANSQRFRSVSVSGEYLLGKSVYVDNQVVDGQVGYQVYTPLLITGSQQVVLIARGWVSVGESRANLPELTTPSGVKTVIGRLNMPPAKPPLWNDKYAVNNGQLWQYLPLDNYAQQMRLSVLPLVVELAPDSLGSEPQFKQVWADIDDNWIAKHKGYAFQWFAMAAAFFIACLVLLFRRNHCKN